MHKELDVKIRTHKNDDGTYDASVGGKRLGLQCVFWFSARSVAMSKVAASVAKGMTEVAYFNPVTQKWEDSTKEAFVASITRSFIGMVDLRNDYEGYTRWTEVTVYFRVGSKTLRPGERWMYRKA